MSSKGQKGHFRYGESFKEKEDKKRTARGTVMIPTTQQSFADGLYMNFPHLAEPHRDFHLARSLAAAGNGTLRHLLHLPHAAVATRKTRLLRAFLGGRLDGNSTEEDEWQGGTDRHSMRTTDRFSIYSRYTTTNRLVLL